MSTDRKLNMLGQLIGHEALLAEIRARSSLSGVDITLHTEEDWVTLCLLGDDEHGPLLARLTVGQAVEVISMVSLADENAVWSMLIHAVVNGAKGVTIEPTGHMQCVG